MKAEISKLRVEKFNDTLISTKLLKVIQTDSGIRNKEKEGIY